MALTCAICADARRPPGLPPSRERQRGENPLRTLRLPYSIGTTTASLRDPRPRRHAAGGRYVCNRAPVRPGLGSLRSGQAGEFYNDEPVEGHPPNCSPGGGHPRRKGAAGAGEAARGEAGGFAAAAAAAARGASASGTGRSRAVGSSRSSSGRGGGRKRSTPQKRSAPQKRNAPRQAQADRGPVIILGPVCPHPVGGLDADRGHRRIRGATCRTGHHPDHQRDRAAPVHETAAGLWLRMGNPAGRWSTT